MRELHTWPPFIFPPRTKMVLPPGPGAARTLWESFPDAVGQWKLHGSRNLTVFHPDGHIEYWGRGGKGQPGELQKQFTVTPAMREQLVSLGLTPGRLHVLDGEFVHAKTKQYKDVLYLFDILVFDSWHLLGNTYGERYALLDGIIHRNVQARSRLFPADLKPIEGTLYLAENFPKEHWGPMYATALKTDYVEGVVVKRTGPVSALEFGGQEYNNSGFMARTRKPNKLYRA